MSNVYANGLEISGQAVGAKTIACFPDVCFTPPENPATPPGVPVPYPSFGMASDTEQGTGTVLIGGKTVNIKNKSDLSKTSGTEAGAAAKKGLISSKNTGKSYFNSWSPNVRFEGEPVIRNTDLATHNHGSPMNAGPWVHVAGVAVPPGPCEAVFATLQGHQHGKSPCNTTTTGNESEHTNSAAGFLHSRQSSTRAEVKCDQWPAYDEDKAPCICMHGRRVKKNKNERRRKGTDHDRKTKKLESFLDQHRAGCKVKTGKKKGKISCADACTVPTVGAFSKAASQDTVDEHEKTSQDDDNRKKEISDCLELINIGYLAGVEKDDSKKDAQKKIDDTKKKKICGKGVCKAKKSKACISCGK